jgi:anti-anti-sigma factor
VIEVRQESTAAAVIDCAGADGAEGVARCVDLAFRLGHTKVVVDLGGRDGADAELLGVLHRSARRMREAGGRLAVVSASSRYRRLLHLTLLSHAFGVYATREEALAG